MSENKKVACDLEQRGDVASLKALYQGAAIGRRAFVSRLAALGISASVAGIIVAGSPVAVAATPKRGGRLRAAAGAHGPDDTLDPARFKFRHQLRTRRAILQRADPHRRLPGGAAGLGRVLGA